MKFESLKDLFWIPKKQVFIVGEQSDWETVSNGRPTDLGWSVIAGALMLGISIGLREYLK